MKTYEGIIDTFAGPGGWDEGLRLIGRRDVLGIEWCKWACKTAEAAGHRRLAASFSAQLRRVPHVVWDPQ